jgi:predicted Zn-dependent protease
LNALDVAKKAVVAAGGDAEAVVLTEHSGLARFAERDVHQPTLIDNAVVTLRVVRDGKVGVAATNRIEPEGLRELARRAGEAADSAVAESEFPGLAPPAEPPEVEGWDRETASLGPDEQARRAAAAIGAAASGVYGFFTSAETELAIASTAGVAVSQRMTDAMTLVVAADEDRSGYAERTSWRAGDFDPAAVAREAADKAARTKDAVDAAPAKYRAVLEPYALGVLLEYFGWDSFGAQGLLEERSYFSGRIGQRIFDEKVTILDDPLDPRGLPKAFDFEGVPKQRVPLIENGVVRGVVWDRVTAAQAGDGHESTGHAPPAALRGHGPFASAISVRGGTAESLDELAELVGDGIYVTRLHYLSVVDPREGIVTGMTRDGTFRIRNGEVAEPLVNLRFTVSVPELLADVPGLTREVALVNANDFYGERYPVGALVPAIATACFNITGAGSRPGL